MKKRSDRFLIWALAISLGLHAVILLGLRHATPVEAKTEPPPQHFSIIVRVPSPTPKPVDTPRPTQTHMAVSGPHISPPRISAGQGPIEGPSADPQGTQGPGVGPGDAATTDPSPVATDSPKPQCSVPNAPAHVIDTVSPSAPEGADDQTGTAQVRVDLAPSGAVVNATIYRSTGNTLLDLAAMHAARSSTYQAETRDCTLVGGSYLFTVDFTQ